MIGVLSFLWLLSAIAFAACVVVFVIRSVKKQSRKPVVLAGVSLLVVSFALMMVIGSMYEPPEKPETVVAESEPVAELAPQPAEIPEEAHSVAPTETSAVVESKQDKPAPSPALASPAPVVESNPVPTQTISPNAEQEPPSEPSVSPAVDSVSEVSLPESSEPVESEPEIDTASILDAFDDLLSDPDYEGAILSIAPRAINGEVFSWAIIDVVVPDGWYYLQNYQKERYCSNVGDYVRRAAVLGGAAKNYDGTACHFYDVAGIEVAKSTLFSGYKILK